ncbi:MAG: methyl-accepting chemotaxis protein [Deltaproteobacteria bacterium]|nr:methyl-accepting chemotaxis protein [Deltaproteobacteria bacterium]
MTDNRESNKPFKNVRQKFFEARALQLSAAVLVVLALIGGILVQSVSTALTSHYGFTTPALGLILIAGYIIIIALIAVFFTYRFIGPFKRLEYEMKLIAAGDISRKLSIRSKDDLYIRHFVRYVNKFLSRFADMSREYNTLNSEVSTGLGEITKEMSKEKFDCGKVKQDIQALQKKIHELREKW